MKIPKSILREASEYIKAVPGAELSYLGKYNEALAFCVEFPDDMKVGYPVVFLLQNNVVTKVIGDEALSIIDELS